jgi:hypothetical protein
MSVYVNGSLAASRTIPATTNVGTIEPGGNFAFGSRANGSSYYVPFWNGLVDDTYIYNRALSAGEIQAIYNATQ